MVGRKNERVLALKNVLNMMSAPRVGRKQPDEKETGSTKSSDACDGDPSNQEVETEIFGRQWTPNDDATDPKPEVFGRKA